MRRQRGTRKNQGTPDHKTLRNGSENQADRQQKHDQRIDQSERRAQHAAEQSATYTGLFSRDSQVLYLPGPRAEEKRTATRRRTIAAAARSQLNIKRPERPLTRGACAQNEDRRMLRKIENEQKKKKKNKKKPFTHPHDVIPQE